MRNSTARFAERRTDQLKKFDVISIIEKSSPQITTLESGKRIGEQLFSSWFDQDYEYRVEEGDIWYEPSKIGAVRRDGEDFDELHLQNLKMRLETSVFPASMFAIYFQSDEFRRYVRIYVDFVQSSNKGKIKRGKLQGWSVVPKGEIQSRIVNAR